MGTDRPDMISIAPKDAERLGLRDRMRITLHSDTGEMTGIVQIAPVKSARYKLTGQKRTC